MALVVVVVTASNQVKRLAVTINIALIVVVILNLEVWHPHSTVAGVFLTVHSEGSIVVGRAVDLSNVVISVIQPEGAAVRPVDTNNLQTINTADGDVLLTLHVNCDLIDVVLDPLDLFHGDVIEHLASVFGLPGEVQVRASVGDFCASCLALFGACVLTWV